MRLEKPAPKTKLTETEDRLTIMNETAHMPDRDQEFAVRAPQRSAEIMDDRLDGWQGDIEAQVTGEASEQPGEDVSDQLPHGDTRDGSGIDHSDGGRERAGRVHHAKARTVEPRDDEQIRVDLMQRKTDLAALVSAKEQAIKEQLATRDDGAQIDYNHPADMVDGDSDYEREMAILTSERTELARVKSALARMAEGRYGVCDICEAAIGAPRLKAVPDATHCLECQSRLERRH